MKTPSPKTPLTGRQRVLCALNHQPADRVPVDLGGTACSGAHVSVVANLRRRLGLDKPGARVKVTEPYQMLGEVGADLRQALGIDVVHLPNLTNMFGYPNAGWKPWTTFDGTEVLVPADFNTDPAPDGSILMYPQGDRSAKPSAKMPKGGYYFDSIIRQPPLDDAKLKPADNLEEFQPISDASLAHYEKLADDLYANTDLAIAAGFPGTAFGDIALVPGPWMKDPKGIRDIEEWYISTITRRQYIREVFARQAEIAIENLKRIHQAVGDKVAVVFMDGTDLASQNSLFCSPDSYRDLYLPHAKKVNDWVHAHTTWKTLKHCCGGCEPLIGGFIDAGYDVLNPVQLSAQGMDPNRLVDKYGDRIVFWGGGVDTQQTLPFGTPAEVKAQVPERIKILNAKNGYVFNPIHNVQCNTPTENMIAMFQALGRSV